MAVSSIAKRLEAALHKIDRPGSFCVQGSVPAVLPGLEIDPLGPIAFPLTPHQAKEVIEQCEQAPYGKGALTLVDKKVRRVWQLMPDRFKLTNPGWQAFLEETTRTVQQGLGLEGKKLQAHLYNLLLYEKGSFFLPHRDGEKLDGMVATLVIVLPSVHEGGELVVRHEGQEQTIDFGSDESSKHNIHFAAFYADCEHEVRPLRKGYRLCLVYNLVMTKSKKGIAAPRSAEHVEAVRDVLQDWDAKDEPTKLVFLLEHRYTKDGLTWDSLKGVDAARARVLREAAAQSGCKTFLAKVTLHESGSAYPDDDYGRYGRYGGYDEDDEDEETEDEEEGVEGEYEMEEVFDSSLTAEQWLDEAGHLLSFGVMELEEEEIIPEGSIQQVKPQEEFEGYTGNAGMTLDRWYRHGAVVVWPEQWHFDNLCDCGTAAAISALQELVKEWKKAGKAEKTDLKKECVRFANIIIDRWSASDGYPLMVTEGQASSQPQLSPVLVALSDPDLIEAYLTRVLPAAGYVVLSDALLNVCAKHGWDRFLPALGAVLRGTAERTLTRNVQLLQQLVRFLSNEGDSEGLGTRLVQTTLAALEEMDSKRSDYHWYVQEKDRVTVVVEMVKAMVLAGTPDDLPRFLDYLSAHPRKYPLDPVQIKALASLKPWLKANVKEPNEGLSRWLTACRQELEGLTATMPTEPTDYRRVASIRCKCALCAELAKFLKDPAESTHRFPAPQDRRDHLEHTIREDRCDVRCTTEKKGRPYTLVCTKTTATYQRDLKKYHENLEHLALVRSIEQHLPS